MASGRPWPSWGGVASGPHPASRASISCRHLAQGNWYRSGPSRRQSRLGPCNRKRSGDVRPDMLTIRRGRSTVLILLLLAGCANGHGTAPSLAAAPVHQTTCPPRWGAHDVGGWVPTPESTASTLVPGQPPRAEICLYDVHGAHQGKARTLQTGLATMTADLNHLPTAPRREACPLLATLTQSYLIKLSYQDGRVSWVGTAYGISGCTNTTNGRIHTTAYIGDAVKHAYDTGQWARLTPRDPCDIGTGRRGQDKHLIPDDPIEVTVCSIRKNAEHKTHGRRVAIKTAKTLNKLPLQPVDHQCSGPYISVIFHYRQGPPAAVTAFGAACKVDNRYVQADVPAALYTQLKKLGTD